MKFKYSRINAKNRYKWCNLGIGKGSLYKSLLFSPVWKDFRDSSCRQRIRRLPRGCGLQEVWKYFQECVQQRWAECEIFRSESSFDPMKLNLIQSWSEKFMKFISLIQSWSANVKSCIFILPHEAKNYWNYFAFSQIQLVEGKIVPAVFLHHEAK